MDVGKRRSSAPVVKSHLANGRSGLFSDLDACDAEAHFIL
jgi:hypothetical protein